MTVLDELVTCGLIPAKETHSITRIKIRDNPGGDRRPWSSTSAETPFLNSSTAWTGQPPLCETQSHLLTQLMGWFHGEFHFTNGVAPILSHHKRLSRVRPLWLYLLAHLQRNLCRQQIAETEHLHCWARRSFSRHIWVGVQPEL